MTPTTPPRTALPELSGSEDAFVFPTSFAQQRLWLLDQLEGELTAYNLPFAFRLRGPLDAEALRRALETIVARHEPLRTNFHTRDGEPVQVVSPPRRLDLPCADLRAQARKQQEAMIASACRTESERPFDLRSDLMLRAQLLGLAGTEHILLLTLHHIAADGWSLRVLWRELEALYDAYRRRADPVLPELPVQYVDFTVWQRQELQGARLERLLEYWRKHLEGLEALDLPTDRPRPSQQSYQGARHPFELQPRLVQQLRELSLAGNATLHMTLLAAFQALLARYSGQRDIAVGMPVAGRQPAELEPLIGFFVNTLVLRADLTGEPTFREVLRRVRGVSLDAYDHQELPFEKLVEELRPERHRSRNPLVQSLFQLLIFPDQDLVLRDLEVLRLPSSSQRVRFDLEMHLRQQAGRLEGTVVYSTDLFDLPTIERLVGHYVTLLEGIVADPDRRISELPLLTAAERQQLLVEWNDTAVEYPRDRCVHELFAAQAARTPDAVAVVFEHQQVTYRELNARSNQLAQHLRSLGVGPETLVGLCLERSVELVVGILGILKAGGAYVPLDMDYPRQRLEFMLADAQVTYLVTQQSQADRLPTSACQVVVLDAEATHLQTLTRSNPALNVRAENLAYVMFTSGSTGQPKGVAIRHTSIVRLVCGSNYVTFGPDRVFLLLATVSFDASTFELWGALLHGAKLVVAPTGLPDVRQLEDLLKRHGVTTLWLTTTLFNHVVEQRPTALSCIEELLIGGEVLSPHHIRTAQRACGSRIRVINGYGPTESTTFATCYSVPSDLGPDPESVPIGRPIANTQVYVLDGHRQLVPIGVPGELHIGGAGLARGYLNRPELTAEKFVPNPFSHAPDSRLYRTGDLGRWRADGNLEFLGRLDRQVKIRGFRVEIGEVEAVLGRHPALRACAVLARRDAAGEMSLSAFLVPQDSASLSATALCAWLAEELPGHMIPARFVVLEALPLTPNGKLDRKALEASTGAALSLGNDYVAPRTELEHRLAVIWQNALRAARVGVRDNFFSLGGHSLHAVRVAGDIDQVLGQKLPIAALFQAPTIESLADWLTKRNWAPAWSSLVPLQPQGAKPPFFFIHGWGGDVFYFLDLAQLLGPEQPSYGIQAVGLDGRSARHRTVEAMAALYVQEILSLQPVGPYYLGGYSMGGVIAFEMARQLQACRRQVGMLALLDTHVVCLIPWAHYAAPVLRHLCRRLRVHIGHWLRMPGRERANYLRGRWAALRYYVRRNRPRQLPTGMQTPGAPSPPDREEAGDYYRELVANYRLTPFAGRADLFVSEGSKPRLEAVWKRYLRGGVTSHRVAGKHFEIIDPDHIRGFAAVFTRALRAAQERAEHGEER